MSTLLQDLRYAARSLFRNPSFAIAAILTLALGIGATTAIFTVVNAVVFRPLPVDRPDRLVAILNQTAVTGTINPTVSAQDFDDWKAQSRSFAVMARYQGGETSVTFDRGADYATVYRVTPGFFDALGVRTSIGRLLSPAEEQPGGPLSVVITDAFWRQRFNGDAKAIGATIKANDSIFTIVGVLAPGLRFPARADIFAPAWIAPVRSSRGGHNFRVIARLQDGVTPRAGARRNPVDRPAPRAGISGHEQEQACDRGAAQGSAGRRHTVHVRHADLGVDRRAADCVRQRRQPPAGEVVGAFPRNGGAGSGRRGSMAVDPAAADRKPGARRGGGAGGRLAGAARRGRAHGAGARGPAARR